MKKIYQTNYAVAVSWCNNSLILCNEIAEIDPTIHENIMPAIILTEDEESSGDADDTEEERVEIYQWYLTNCSQWDIDYLRHTFGLTFTYSELLDLYVLCVTHYGTSWDYVSWPTTNEIAERKLGQSK